MWSATRNYITCTFDRKQCNCLWERVRVKVDGFNPLDSTVGAGGNFQRNI